MRFAQLRNTLGEERTGMLRRLGTPHSVRGLGTASLRYELQLTVVDSTLCRPSTGERPDPRTLATTSGVRLCVCGVRQVGGKALDSGGDLLHVAEELLRNLHKLAFAWQSQ